jgi:flagellar hook-basal body complex protein FliE
MLIGGAESLASAAPKLDSTARASAGSRSSGAAGVSAGFSQLLEGVEKTAAEANDAVSAMVNKTGDVHDAMIALQRAQMALELTVQIRNKFVQAYQDIMRMPI